MHTSLCFLPPLHDECKPASKDVLYNIDVCSGENSAHSREGIVCEELLTSRCPQSYKYGLEPGKTCCQHVKIVAASSPVAHRERPGQGDTTAAAFQNTHSMLMQGKHLKQTDQCLAHMVFAASEKENCCLQALACSFLSETFLFLALCLSNTCGSC